VPAGRVWITVGFHRLLTHRSFATHRINSICHFFGRRRFAVDDRSGNVLWLAPFSLGESWHHNHHAFACSAAHGLRWWEVDPSALVIRAIAPAGTRPERGADPAGAAAPKAAAIESGP